jgi:hypothetical protein
MVLRSAL